MKHKTLTAVLLIGTFAASGFCQGSALEEKVRLLFMQEDGPPRDIPNDLRQLGGEREIAESLLQMASRYKHAEAGTIEFKLLRPAVSLLGELRANSANEFLSSLATDSKVHQSVRAMAIRSLGQIDSEANKQILIRALDPSEHPSVRINAAEGLAKTKDAEALKALERFGREEKDSYVRNEFGKAENALREKGVRE
jgi:hypothetical protein